MKSERLIGLDILRILSMMGIIGLHVINNGGYMRAANSPLQQVIIHTMAIICYCSVNVFAMLTGYLYAERKNLKSGSLIKLLITVVFYCTMILSMFVVFKPVVFKQSRMLYLYALIPPLAGRYWYITAYVLLFMMIPYINTMTKSLTEMQFRRMLLILFVLLSVVSTVGFSDYFKIDNGYSPFWLMFCYLIGAYIKLHRNTFNKQHLIKCACVFATNILIVVTLWFAMKDTVFEKYFIIYAYTSPFMVINAATLLLIFSKISIQNRLCKNVIIRLSNGAFGVYIIHSHILVYDYLLANAFTWMSGKGTLTYVEIMFVALLGIYLVCWIVDEVRKLIFSKICVDKLIDKIGNKLDGFLYWNQIN